MMPIVTPIDAARCHSQSKINLFDYPLAGALISLFEQRENAYIVFRGNPSFEREKGWRSI